MTNKFYANIIIIIVVFFYACGEQSNNEEETTELYQEPLIVKLDTINGYKVNQLTGDSIETLINNYGDTILTGRAIPITGKVIHPDSVSKPKVVKAGKPTVVPAHTNIRKIPENLTVIPINEDSLETFTPGIDTSSFVLVNSTGDTIPTGVPIRVKGKVVQAYQPKPIRALPFRMKPNATDNILFLDDQQGKISSYLFSIIEGKSGNMWFTYQTEGICKYDGNSFINYTEKEGLTNIFVRTIEEDRNRNLWIGTNGNGLSKYDGKNFTHYSEKEGLPNNYISSIYEDSKGNLWFGTLGGGVSKYNGDSFIHYSIKEGLIGNLVYSILEDSEENLWFGTSAGACKFDGKIFTHYTEKDGLSNKQIYSILVDSKDNIWFCTFGGGISMYDCENFTHYTVKEGLSDNSVISALEDKNGNLWFGTLGNGVNKYDGNSFTQYTQKEGLTNKRINSIFENKQGDLWFGTWGDGVYKFRTESFTYYDEKVGFSDNIVISIFKDKNENLWFGTADGGVSKYDGKSFTNYTVKEGLPNNTIWSIHQDSNENIWFGTKRGVSKYDGKSFINYTIKEGLIGTNVTSILEDFDGNLWFGTTAGISKYDGKSFTNYTDKEGISSNIIRSIHQDSIGTLWFGTKRGVSKYDGQSFIHYTEKEGLSNNDIISITESSDGNLWFGSWGGGVNKYDGSSFTYYTEKEGLSDNIIHSIHEDKSNNLWVNTEKGLSLFSNELGLLLDTNKKEERKEHSPGIISFENQDGLKGIDCFPNSAFLDNKDRLWWGTGECLTMLDLNNFKLPDYKPLIQLNSININQNFIDYRQLKGNLSSIDSTSRIMYNDAYKKLSFDSVAAFYNYPLNLELPYNLNHLTFNFSAIDWSAPHKLKYQYKLEGLDDKWSQLTDENKADYRNIPYGEYIFKVKAIGAANKWSDTFEYSFVIRPPWWHTWLARTFYLIIFISLIWSFIKLRTAKLKKNQKVLEHKVKERTFEVVEQKKEIEAMNDELHQQNDEILSINDQLSEQKEIIEQKNIHITDSINYAQQIQESVFLSEIEIKDYFSDSFLLNMPKDIVSGDFFWFHKVDNKKIFAVVDCTGHGVPGAIMSMIGNTLLTEIIKDHKITDPAEILNTLHTGVMNVLRQDKDTSKANDGMDMVICVYDEIKKELYFSGARNFMYVHKDNKLETINGDFFSIGEKPYIEDQEVKFTTHKVKISSKTKLYLMTDGYMDQFGGPDNKKFNQLPFEKMLNKISNLPMKEQKEKMLQAFTDWKGSNNQIDDIMILGVKLR